jgi:hypothetical protein
VCVPQATLVVSTGSMNSGDQTTGKSPWNPDSRRRRRIHLASGQPVDSQIEVTRTCVGSSLAAAPIAENSVQPAACAARINATLQVIESMQSRT